MQNIQFKDFSTVVEKKYMSMVKSAELGQGILVRTQTNVDEIYNLYLNSFPEEENQIFRVRRQHDCNCCKNFIRRVGNLVLIYKDLTFTTLWDITVPGFFQNVSDKLNLFIRNSISNIDTLYMTSEGIAGSLSNYDKQSPDIKWDHFYVKVPQQYIQSPLNIGTLIGNNRANYDVLKSSLEKITSDSIDIVLELIGQGSLIRGSEYKQSIEKLRKLKTQYDAIEDQIQKNIFLWIKSAELKESGRFKNTVIGSLLLDISEGKDLDKSIDSYGNKVDPRNYRRTTATVTPSMINKCIEELRSNGYEDSIERRFALPTEIPDEELLFTYSKGTKSNSLLDDIQSEVSEVAPKKLNIKETIHVDKFIKEVLPSCNKVEVLFDRKLAKNLVSLLTSVHDSSKNLFKWASPMSWAYNGDVTDSIKERVKKLGGSVAGDLRVSLSWYNADDLDISCVTPSGKKIYYHDRRYDGGYLDVDCNGLDHHDEFEPVENIIFTDKRNMKKGSYEFYVHNYSKRNMKHPDRQRDGFELQVEFDGQVFDMSFENSYANNARIKAFDIVNDGNSFTIKNVHESLKSILLGGSEIWNIKTGNFINTNKIVNSPNYWLGSNTGNKHLIFILEGCKNPETTRGFYNEYLKPELNQFRKSFELLGSKTKATPDLSKDQASGLGFSTDSDDVVTLRLSGKMQRIVNVSMK